MRSAVASGAAGAIVSATQLRYETLVELAPDGILVHDGECVIFANAATLRLAGANGRNEVVGRPIGAFLAPPYLKAIQDEIAGSTVALQSSPPVRELFTRLDGSTVAVETRALPYLDSGRPAILLVVRDVSDRVAADGSTRVMEQRLHEAQRMEAVGALAGGVAHEVNNMMTVVLGNAHFLLNDGDLSAASASDVEHIVQAASRAAVITQQLLAFSRRTNTTPIIVDVSAAVDAAQTTLQRIVSARTILFESAVHAPVCIDPAQLEQVLVNLMLNARDATVPGGRIQMTTGTVELAFGQTCAEGVVMSAGAYATITVKDDGCGMDEVTQKRIFEPFFTTKAVGKGTGLGLPAVHGLLRQSGCYISVESAEGHGAEFTVFLPIQGQESTNQRDRAQSHYTATVSEPRATILVVDGEPSVRIIALRALEESGFSVVTAADGREALALIERHDAPDLVVSDIMTAAVGGQELARRLSLGWPQLPIIFLSGYSPEELFQTSGERDHPITVQKPFTPAQLTSSVNRCLMQHAARQADRR